MRQDTSGSSRQVVDIGNRRFGFIDTALERARLAREKNARRELPSRPHGFALIATASAIAAPEDRNASVDVVGCEEHWQ